MKSLYRFQSEVTFYAILLLGILYFLLFVKLLSFFSPLIYSYIGSFTEKCMATGVYYVQENRSVILISGFLLVFMVIGFVFSAVKTVITAVKTNAFIKELNILKIKDGVNYFHSSAALSFTYGYIRPKVYVSSWMLENLDKNEFEAMIMHEISHKKEFHNFRKILVQFILGLFFYVPGKNALIYNYNIINELSSDEYTYNRTGSKTPLVSAIAKIFESGDSYILEDLMITQFTIRYSRAKSLVSDNKKFHFSYLVSIGAIIISVASLLTIASSSDVNAKVVLYEKAYTYGYCVNTESDNDYFSPANQMFTPSD